MRWRGRRESTRVEDRRGARGVRLPGGKGAGIGCGGLLLILLLAYFTGENPVQLLESLGTSSSVSGPSSGLDGTPAPGPRDELSQFASVVLADTEDTWTALFQRESESYRLPTLVLFSGSVASACGYASSAVGPFYCPADGKVYLDLSFFDELARRFGAPGDFAQAYVIAHEIGHHVQNLLGISAEIRRRQQGASQTRANELSVRLELQADCLAGVWGYHAQDLLEPGDIEEGLAAAAAIGDDQMQRRAGGYVRPESWTHGSSQQRVTWLRRGLQSGDPDACDTFN
jgi:hypothetical protein